MGLARVVRSTSGPHDQILKAFLQMMQGIRYNPATLGATDQVLHARPDAGHPSVERAKNVLQLPAHGLLGGTDQQLAGQAEPLETQLADCSQLLPVQQPCIIL